MQQDLLATEIGVRARTLLGEPNRRLRVLAPVHGAIYIEDEWGEIIWLADRRAALHSRAILVADVSSLEEVSRGTRCFVHENYLHVGENVVVNLSCAAVWAPTVVSTGIQGPAEWGKRFQGAVQRAAWQSAPPRSLIYNMLHLPEATDSALPRERAVLSSLLRGAAVLGSVRVRRDLPCALEEARELVGLGEGLTPSGDDLLGGYLFTLHLVDHASEHLLGIDWDCVEEWATPLPT